MQQKYCSHCGTPLNGLNECSQCGEKVISEDFGQSNNQQNYNQNNGSYYQKNPYLPCRSKLVAGLLAIFLGGLGVHKFYLDQVGMGIIYIIFACTGIPSIIGFIEGIIYLCITDEEFERKYNVRSY